jgi:hypothetical protein
LEIVPQETVLCEIVDWLGEFILEAAKFQALPELGWKIVIVGGAMYRETEIVTIRDEPHDSTLEMLKGLRLAEDLSESIVDARH